MYLYDNTYFPRNTLSLPPEEYLVDSQPGIDGCACTKRCYVDVTEFEVNRDAENLPWYQQGSQVHGKHNMDVTPIQCVLVQSVIEQRLSRNSNL